ncbi:MAG: hypothetical protein AAF297_11975 [Planctomycetota bacterium]
MPHRLFRLYQRKRVININANVIAAGLGSTAIVAGLLALLKYAVKTDWPTWGYTAFSLGADIVLDVAIFAGLHWIANHWRPSKGRSQKEKLELGAAAPPHLEDTARVQIERAILSPLYYLIAVAATEALQQLGLRPYWAVLIAYPLGLLVTRTLHTWWGLRSGTFDDHHIRAKKLRIKAKREARKLARSRGRGHLPDM